MMKRLLNKLNSTWTALVLVVAVLGTVGGLAIAGNEAKKKLSTFEKAIINLERIASQVDSHDFLVEWLLAHGEDSATVAQWSLFPRGAITDTAGAPLLNVIFLDPNALPERGVLRMHVAPDSVVSVRTLWNYPKETNK